MGRCCEIEAQISRKEMAMKQIFERIQSTSEYCGFKLYGGCEPISEILLGRVTQWFNLKHLANPLIRQGNSPRVDLVQVRP